jgi:hypothetical protein
MRCRADDADAMCSWRAAHKHDLRFSLLLHTWMFFVAPQIVLFVSRCPGCAEPLPTPSTLAGRWAAGDFGGDE